MNMDWGLPVWIGWDAREEAAAEVAAREARRELRDKRKADVKADFDERVGKLKEKLYVA